MDNRKVEQAVKSYGAVNRAQRELDRVIEYNHRNVAGLTQEEFQLYVKMTTPGGSLVHLSDVTK